MKYEEKQVTTKDLALGLQRQIASNVASAKKTYVRKTALQERIINNLMNLYELSQSDKNKLPEHLISNLTSDLIAVSQQKHQFSTSFMDVKEAKSKKAKSSVGNSVRCLDDSPDQQFLSYIDYQLNAEPSVREQIALLEQRILAEVTHPDFLKEACTESKTKDAANLFSMQLDELDPKDLFFSIQQEMIAESIGLRVLSYIKDPQCSLNLKRLSILKSFDDISLFYHEERKRFYMQFFAPPVSKTMTPATQPPTKMGRLDTQPR